VNKDGRSWRVSDWTEGPRHPVGSGGVVAFSPDGRLAAWGWQKGFVALVEPETGRELARLEDPHQDGLAWLTFSPDGTRLIGTTNDSFCIRVWDLRKIRTGLKGLGLDWDARPYPAGTEPGADAPRPAPLQIEVVGAEKLRTAAHEPPSGGPGGGPCSSRRSSARTIFRTLPRAT
jgi:hypothetical protein